MPSEEYIIDQGKALDFNPEFKHLFYSAGLGAYLFNESGELSMISQVGLKDIWEDHSSNECIVSFCGGMPEYRRKQKLRYQT